MFGKQLRSRFNVITHNDNYRAVRRNICKAQDNQEKYCRGNRKIEFRQGEFVICRDYRNVNSVSWIDGVISKRIGKKYIFCGNTRIRAYVETSYEPDKKRINPNCRQQVTTSDIPQNDEKQCDTKTLKYVLPSLHIDEDEVSSNSENLLADTDNNSEVDIEPNSGLQNVDNVKTWEQSL